MTARTTIAVVWRADRGKWTVEGGHGTAAVLGIVSLHDSKVAAIRAAHDVARDHDAQVDVVGDPSESLGGTAERS